MENKEITNESNLPEKGAQEVNSETSDQNDAVDENAVSNEMESDTPEDEVKEEVVEAPTETSDELPVEEVVEVSPNAIPEEEKPVEAFSETPDSVVESEVETEEPKAVEEEVKAETENKPDAEDVLIEEKSEEAKEEKLKVRFVPEDYSTFDRPTLLAKLNSLINNFDVEIIKEAIENIKTVFYKQYKAEVAEARKVFVDGGGVSEDFKFSDETSEETFKVLYNRFKERKAVLTKRLEKEKIDNLRIKHKIIAEIDVLINKEESINKTFHEFRDLQQRWREIGLVPQNAVKSLWESYNHTVEKFYDYIKINKELRDLDLKNNLELKVELCEKAEALLLEESVTKAFKILQEYHNQWREIGPVPSEQKEDIWERFKAATTQINKMHQEYFEGLKDLQVQNLEQKTALCEKIEQLLDEKVEKPKQWEEKAKEIIEIQKLWRTIGFAPKKHNNRIYLRFKTTCDDFFARKRDFYREVKDVQKNNMQIKLDLCVQAEALKDSTEWRKSTEDFINLQKKWKEIGPVPKKYSETLWKRFRTACDFFFNTKSEFFHTVDSRQEDNLKLKLELIEKVKSFEKADSDKENLKQLMEIQKQWTNVGHVPLNKKDEIQKDFREAINAQFDTLKIDDSERNKINYKSKVDNWVNSNSRGKIYSERNKLVNKIKELENEIALYENNIGFFSASSSSQGLLDDVNRKIEKAKERMLDLKNKVRMIDKAEDDM
ncbi:MAG: DUF349 domain-containing protein [Salinivirgaceae bacterium]|jgi:hypothetical protein|nr:DUF349 domain-containing protein [Salinivirgaceae bacterium]